MVIGPDINDAKTAKWSRAWQPAFKCGHRWIWSPWHINIKKKKKKLWSYLTSYVQIWDNNAIRCENFSFLFSVLYPTCSCSVIRKNIHFSTIFSLKWVWFASTMSCCCDGRNRKGNVHLCWAGSLGRQSVNASHFPADCSPDWLLMTFWGHRHDKLLIYLKKKKYPSQWKWPSPLRFSSNHRLCHRVCTSVSVSVPAS